jgi:tRNA U34 5-methylaminomethyl-2-thiouridine-forming methyltransferase MnmC
MAAKDEFPKALQAVETGDGSKTLYDPERDVHYRSIHGARRESNYVFLDATKLTERESPWRVLELGFGAAVNFTGVYAAASERSDVSVEYHSVDYRPVAPDDIDFHEDGGGELARRALKSLRESGGDEARVRGLDGRLELHLHVVDWLDLDLEGFRADAVFYDPFGPRAEPESWTTSCFEVARRHMAPHGILATYSAATRVKKAMAEAGLFVASLPGPGRKREMTLASPTERPIEHAEILDFE